MYLYDELVFPVNNLHNNAIHPTLLNILNLIYQELRLLFLFNNVQSE